MGDLVDTLRLAAINRHRKRLFGDDVLKIFGVTPGLGETEIGQFAADWTAKRIRSLTDSIAEPDSGAWQFQIAAPEDWETTQIFLRSGVTAGVGTRRWRITKTEKPIGQSLVWKLRAEIQ